MKDSTDRGNTMPDETEDFEDFEDFEEKPVFGVYGKYADESTMTVSSVTATVAYETYEAYVSKGVFTAVSVYEETEEGRVPSYGWIVPEHAPDKLKYKRTSI